MNQPLTSEHLAKLLHDLADTLESDPVTTYTDDDVLAALKRVRSTADDQICKADHVRGLASSRATRRRWRRRL
jgi:hypothetical protein